MITKKFNHCLAIRTDYFNSTIKSKRLSRYRLNIHFKLDIIKRKFRNKLKNRYKYLKNADDDDPITIQSINTIPPNNLYVYNLTNGEKMGINCASLLKWITTFEYDEFPKNIYTNQEMTSHELLECYNQAYNYYCNNIFFKKYYIEKYPEKYIEKQELEHTMHEFYHKNIDRMNPNNVLSRLKNVIDDNIRIVGDYMSYIFGYNIYEFIDLQRCSNIHLDENIITLDAPIEFLDIISRHSFYALSYMEQYNELLYKINSGHFDRYNT